MFLQLRDLSQHLVPVVGVLAFIVAVTSVILIWQARRQAVYEGKIKAELVSRVASEQTLRAFQTTELALQRLGYLLEHGPPLPENDEGFAREMQAAIRDLPHIRAIHVVAPDGFIIHATTFPHSTRIRVSDRDYFVAQLKSTPEGRGTGVYIGQPIRSRGWEGWFIPVSRRINRRDTGFSGVIVAAIEPKYFEDLFRDLNLESGDALALFNTDGNLIARFPKSPGLIGRSWSQLRLPSGGNQLSPTHAGLRLGQSLENKPVVISYRRLATYPVIAAVLLGQRELLAHWRQVALEWGVSSVALIVLMLAFAVVLQRRRQERQTAEARALAIQRFETVGHMTSGIAHDFNNVLAVVAASLRLLRNGKPPDQVLPAAEQALERGQRLTSQLLGFARRHSLEIKPHDIDQLVVALQPMLKQAAGPKCTVSYRLNSSGTRCHADQAQFDAAMLNLVVNAAQAMDRGSIEIITEPVMLDRRSKTALKPGRYVSVKVKDDGCGIPADALGRVFEAFYTTKKESGTGLGLAQVYTFMHYVHGDVRIESQVGVGTTVELLFPCA
jgi:two-component system NtrC family sensor kinase